MDIVHTSETALSRSTRTDWFIHEVRNALAVSTPEVNWTADDYKRSRKIMINFKRNLKKHNPNINGQGDLSDDQIVGFAKWSTSFQWNAENVKEVSSEFNKLIEGVL